MLVIIIIINQVTPFHSSVTALTLHYIRSKFGSECQVHRQSTLGNVSLHLQEKLISTSTDRRLRAIPVRTTVIIKTSSS